ncbi:hypothetical protein OYT1_ch0085 [Ferriphaselus amnicola]|uniref:MAE-28990/MAE-18760-like HEPN domain-containing protein n=1 Tax=Ferriphaselus amnicola TaxID=1188319 RepID=A0A2Z6G874_9PROT|nr:hypothetical protein [Ferriphaselus amnicola]BBE49661.1 hypothetical protein OYT1_ch0085 [Ferriphaselus amnicola]
MAHHYVLETADALTLSYEILALEHKRSQSLGFETYRTTFPLLMLNASIIEGTLRFWLASSVKHEMARLIEQGTQLGKTEKDKAEQLLEKFLIEIEGSGGFEKLVSQYNFYFDISLVAKNQGYDQEAIKALFTLRNVLAHGTAVIAPKHPASSPDKENYVDNWQSRLQQVNTVIFAATGTSDVYAALKDYRLPEYFFGQSKTFLKSIYAMLPQHTVNAGIAYSAFTDLSFGFRGRTR